MFVRNLLSYESGCTDAAVRKTPEGGLASSMKSRRISLGLANPRMVPATSPGMCASLALRAVTLVHPALWSPVVVHVVVL
eukprot:6890510-Pyramimonas_sp.AAC.1